MSNWTQISQMDTQIVTYFSLNKSINLFDCMEVGVRFDGDILLVDIFLLIRLHYGL